jgi:hypothetical protein
MGSSGLVMYRSPPVPCSNAQLAAGLAQIRRLLRIVYPPSNDIHAGYAPVSRQVKPGGGEQHVITVEQDGKGYSRFRLAH